MEYIKEACGRLLGTDDVCVCVWRFATRFLKMTCGTGILESLNSCLKDQNGGLYTLLAGSLRHKTPCQITHDICARTGTQRRLWLKGTARPPQCLRQMDWIVHTALLGHEALGSCLLAYAPGANKCAHNIVGTLWLQILCACAEARDT